MRKAILDGLLVALFFPFTLRADGPIVNVTFEAATSTVEISFLDQLHENSSTHTVTIGTGPQNFDPRRTLIYYEDETGTLVQVKARPTIPADPNFVLLLSDFMDLSGHAVQLLDPQKERRYTILIRGANEASEFIAHVSVKNKQTPPWEIKLTVDDDKAPVRNRSKVVVQLDNNLPTSDARKLFETFRNTPSHVRVNYKFSPDDYVSDRQAPASSLSEFNSATAFGSTSGTFTLKSSGTFPLRPKSYKIEVQFPVKEMAPDLASRLRKSPTDEFVSAGIGVTLSPPKVERATSIFYFESTLSSTVSVAATGAKSRKNAGVFALHWKPLISLLSWNVNADERPYWGALRPILESDVDTLPIKTSKSLNRTTFGFDFDLGTVSKTSFGNLAGDVIGPNTTRTGPPAFLDELIFTNGLRFDADRDFKVITAYWHTELTPKFLKFEQTQDQRIWRYRFAHSSQKPGTFPKDPTITAYKFQPSTGYDLGGVTRRAGTPNPVLGDSVSRYFIKLDSSLELARFLTFAATDTSYYVTQATRRQFRGYLEARIELNSGSLFRTDLFGLQNAIVFKFQRGEQPPLFTPANTLSLGFKIYQ
jgi:hypothetical protein